MSIYVFDARLEEWGPFVTAPASRKLALPARSDLAALHALIQDAFGWDDDHLYSFWLDGEFWGAKESEYTLPFELEPGADHAGSAEPHVLAEADRRLACRPGGRERIQEATEPTARWLPTWRRRFFSVAGSRLESDPAGAGE